MQCKRLRSHRRPTPRLPGTFTCQRKSDLVRTIPWVTLLCEMGTARPLRRWTATKHGRYNERFYHKEPVMPTKAGTCSMGTLGRVEHRARNASGHREDMPHCRPDDVRGGFVLCRCVEWADLARRLERRHGQNVGGKRVLTCRPRLFSPFALCKNKPKANGKRLGHKA